LDKHKNFTKISNKSGEPPDKFDGFREFWLDIIRPQIRIRQNWRHPKKIEMVLDKKKSGSDRIWTPNTC
jgi:hypothetical protein